MGASDPKFGVESDSDATPHSGGDTARRLEEARAFLRDAERRAAEGAGASPAHPPAPGATSRTAGPARSAVRHAGKKSVRRRDAAQRSARSVGSEARGAWAEASSPPPAWARPDPSAGGPAAGSVDESAESVGRADSSGADPSGADPSGADPYEVARSIVLDQLSHAPRSRHQLEQKLASRDCAPDVAAAVLDRFTEVGLVDDAAYAAMLVRSQQQTRGLARRALSRELRRKGVDPETAQDALEQVEPGDEEHRARALVDRKLRTMHGLPAPVQTRRLAGMLARKGYSSGLAYQVIRRAIDEAPEHVRD